MVFIWLFLLGWARILTGHYSLVEIFMTVAVGVACVPGIVIGSRWRTGVSPLKASGTVVLFAALQLLALRISLLPYIAHR